MAYIIGVDDVSKKVKDIAVGVDGVAHAIKSAYIGVDGVARKFYQRGYYEKRLYFFGYTGTLDTEYLTNKIYSVKPDGSDPIEYTLDNNIYAYRTITYYYYKPSYADWDYIENAKMYYDPQTKRLCVVGYDGLYLRFYTIDCTKNAIIHQSRISYNGIQHTTNETVYYSNELGCVFVAEGGTNNTGYLTCYNIRTTTLTTKEHIMNTTSSSFKVRGLYACKNNDITRLVLIVADNAFAYRDMQCKVVDWDVENNTTTNVSISGNIPTGLNRVTFIAPHSFINKNIFGIKGICFVNNNATTEQSNAGYVCSPTGVSSFSVTASYITDRQFGFSNTHGAMWVQGANGARLAKYGNNYTDTNNPTGAMANNSGRTYDGPVIGGGVITGYTSTNAAVIYVNISGSYYNITPTTFGPYNNAICEGVNLKEILIPGNDRFLVYDFNQAAYTTPISVANAGVTPVPYTAVLTWTQEEQDALVNLGY